MRIERRSIVGSTALADGLTVIKGRVPAGPLGAAGEDHANLSALARLVRGGEHTADLVRELRAEVRRGIYEVPPVEVGRDIVDFYRDPV